VEGKRKSFYKPIVKKRKLSRTWDEQEPNFVKSLSEGFENRRYGA